jgi:hypothetical protein
MSVSRAIHSAADLRSLAGAVQQDFGASKRSQADRGLPAKQSETPTHGRAHSPLVKKHQRARKVKGNATFVHRTSAAGQFARI